MRPREYQRRAGRVRETARPPPPRAPADSVVLGETLATNSASCWVGHSELAISADRQDREGVVVKAADTPCPGDLAVGVEPRHRRARRHRGKPVNRAAAALL